jgi:hypothetical protein
MRFALLAALVLAATGCGAADAAAAAAAKDPMHCERDPTCAKARGAYPDCTKQCVDDPECTSRCEQVQQGTDSLGHP